MQKYCYYFVVKGIFQYVVFVVGVYVWVVVDFDDVVVVGGLFDVYVVEVVVDQIGCLQCDLYYFFWCFVDGQCFCLFFVVVVGCVVVDDLLVVMCYVIFVDKDDVLVKDVDLLVEFGW